MAAASRSNLIITGGWAHPFARTAPCLAGVLTQAGIDSVIATTPDAAGEMLGTPVDLVTVYACWFEMLDDRYDEVRATWSRTTPTSLRTGITNHIDRGGGVLALHTAPICFGDWPQWDDVLGGSWNWSRSFHPPSADLDVRRSDGEHPIMFGIDRFTVVDERYSDLDVGTDVEILASTHVEDTASQPTVWVRSSGSARVAYDALGHDVASLEHPVHQVLLRRCALWACAASDDDVRRQG